MIYKFDLTETEIIGILSQFQKDYSEDKTLTDRPQMTSRIKKYLVDLGYKNGFGVCCSEFGDRKAWLYDLVWYKNNSEKYKEHKFQILESIPLVVESEIDARINEIKLDFEKLLLANSEHRLMICFLGKNDSDFLKQYFIDSINSYNLCKKGDRFLIAIFDENEGEFEFMLSIKE